MNKTFSFLTLAMLMVLSVGIVCAVPVSADGPQGTLVGGTIYTDNNHNGIYDLGTDTPISGATVTVQCNAIVNSVHPISDSNGIYGVSFDVSQCKFGDPLLVSADKGSMHGSNSGTVTDYVNLLHWNVGIVDVPMVPEFGIAVGALTILSAVAVFFVIRRK